MLQGRYGLDQPERQTKDAMLLQIVHQFLHIELTTLPQSEYDDVGMDLPWQSISERSDLESHPHVLA